MVEHRCPDCRDVVVRPIQIVGRGLDADRSVKPGHEILVDRCTVQVGRANRVCEIVRPVQLAAVDRETGRPDRSRDEVLVDVGAGGIRPTYRRAVICAEIGPVDIRRSRRDVVRTIRADNEVLIDAGAVELGSPDGVVGVVRPKQIRSVGSKAIGHVATGDEVDVDSCPVQVGPPNCVRT